MGFYFLGLDEARRTKKMKKVKNIYISLSYPVGHRLDQVGHQRRRAVDELGKLVHLGEVARLEEVGDPVRGLGSCFFPVFSVFF